MKLDHPIFQDADKARRHLEAQRWPNGPVCPHCGNAKRDRITAMKGKAHRDGLYNCQECRQQFTVTVGTVFERSKIPLNKWLLATFLLTSSKKGMSAHQLHRMLGVTYKTAWFMAHRIREAMKEDYRGTGLGGEGKTVQADETYYGKRETPHVSPQRRGRPYIKSGKSGGAQKMIVFGLVEKGGKSRTFHVQAASKATIQDILFRNVDRKSALHTDEAGMYVGPGREFASHETVNHSRGEYARGDVNTNSIESYFSVFKRGMRGVYQHCGEAHLHRYLAEFDFRYNRRTALKITDAERHADLLSMIGGKRLTYRRTGQAQNA